MLTSHTSGYLPLRGTYLYALIQLLPCDLPSEAQLITVPGNSRDHDMHLIELRNWPIAVIINA